MRRGEGGARPVQTYRVRRSRPAAPPLAPSPLAGTLSPTQGLHSVYPVVAGRAPEPSSTWKIHLTGCRRARVGPDVKPYAGPDFVSYFSAATGWIVRRRRR